VEDVAYDVAGWKRRSIIDGAADFVAAIRTGRPSSVSLEDARYSVRLLECAYRSVALGGLKVDVPSP
jgi:predicted dehydrogenase